MSEAAANSILNGIGVVIDDRVLTQNPEEDGIVDILAQIEKAGIPYLVYKKIPPPDTCKHFANVAFILLDWQLWQKPVEELVLGGVTAGSNLEEEGEQANIAFLQGLKGSCFAPVFIFSNLAPGGIEEKLRKANLLGADDKHAFILVRRKSDLKGAAGKSLLAAVNDWIEGNPSIYVLSHWKDAVTRSQNQLFWDLYDKHPAWPSVLWKTYDGEGDDPEHSLADILLRNMRARLFPLELKSDLVAPAAAQPPDCATTREVLEASMIVPAARLPSDQYGCGDIFRDSKKHYWINIRCDCDCIPRNGNDHTVVELYLLAAQPMTTGQYKKTFDDKYGQTQPGHKYHVLFPFEGKGLRVEFSSLRQVRVGDFNSEGASRIGRLTPPYITQLRQRFALHLQREDLPRIPNEAVPDAGKVAADAGKAEAGAGVQSS